MSLEGRELGLRRASVRLCSQAPCILPVLPIAWRAKPDSLRLLLSLAAPWAHTSKSVAGQDVHHHFCPLTSWKGTYKYALKGRFLHFFFLRFY